MSNNPATNDVPGSTASQGTSRLVLSVRLTKEFPPPVGKLLDGIEIGCHEGEIIALLGTSGSGKTTILKILAGLLPNNSATTVNGLHDSECNTHAVGLAFQRPELLPWRDTAGNACHEGEVLGMNSSKLADRVNHLLALTQLSSFCDLYPEELSVGMQQRLQLIRVLACPRPIMLLDEPLGAVDQPLRLRIAEAIRKMLKADRSACLWVTHDSIEAVTIADTVLVLGGKPLQILMRHKVRRDVTNDTIASEASLISESSLDGQAAELRRRLVNAIANSDAPEVNTNRLAATARLQSGRQSLLSLALPALPILVLLLAWECVVMAIPQLRFYVSSPLEWIPLLVKGIFSGALVKHLFITLTEAGVGLIIGAPLGILTGFTAASTAKLSTAMRPALIGMSAVPLFVLAPAFILWFGIGLEMKIAIAALSAFPFVAYMTHDGAIEAKGMYYRYLQRHAKPVKLFTSLVVPSALEGIIESLRPAAIAALIGAFLGEFIAANNGLGYYIILQASRYHVAEVFAGVSLLFCVAISVDVLARKAAQNRHRLVSFFRRALQRKRIP